MDLLRFFTAGNVDDGKSTLIGRLLFDSNSISTDIVETLTRQSKTKGVDTGIDLALLTDGLRAEREQGITIDVAYKYFSTNKRKFIIADTPGHIQYTRNMVTGASNADLAIVLIDARNGITEQTKRHTILSQFIGIPHLLVCINKMDLVGYSEEVYNNIVIDFNEFAKNLNLKAISFIPVSALAGDNVVSKSARLQWYTGKPLLQFLEEIPLQTSTETTAARFQVQYIIRPQTHNLPDYRGYAGKIQSGQYRKGDKVIVLPSNIETEIIKIEKHQKEVSEASENEPVVIHLKDDVDVSRGNSFVKPDQLPGFDKELEATLCWMDLTEAAIGQKYILQQNSFQTRVLLKDIRSKVDIHTNEKIKHVGTLKLNEIADVKLKTAEYLAYDNYKTNRSTGSFILINENTYTTVAAGIVN